MLRSLKIDGTDAAKINDVRYQHHFFIWITIKKIVCCVFEYFKTFPPHGSEHIIILGGTVNLIPLQDLSSLHELSGGAYLQGCTRVNFFHQDCLFLGVIVYILPMESINPKVMNGFRFWHRNYTWKTHYLKKSTRQCEILHLKLTWYILTST